VREKDLFEAGVDAYMIAGSRCDLGALKVLVGQAVAHGEHCPVAGGQ
jgi:hypothetical protein